MHSPRAEAEMNAGRRHACMHRNRAAKSASAFHLCAQSDAPSHPITAVVSLWYAPLHKHLAESAWSGLEPLLSMPSSSICEVQVEKFISWSKQLHCICIFCTEVDRVVKADRSSYSLFSMLY